jgi:hypothetical protein
MSAHPARVAQRVLGSGLLAHEIEMMMWTCTPHVHSQIALDPSTDWAHYQKKYLPLYKQLKKEVIALTEPKPIPPAAGPTDQQQLQRPLTLAYIERYGLGAPSTVLPYPPTLH